MVIALFVVSAVIVITGLFKLVGLVFGNDMNLPIIIPFTTITPTHFFAWYPSLAFQVWFWADKFSVVA